MELELKKEQIPSIIKDPFSQNKITKVLMVFNCEYSGPPIVYSSVEFKNGDTSGKQEIRANSMDELYLKTAEFIKNLK